MSVRTRKWLAVFTVVLTLAALAALVGPAHDATPESNVQAFAVAPDR
ncbi:MAG: hypothetical protein Q8J92_14890 [Parvibaculum sp.]|nr:hypothetical protein [Parvibaculum sp.]MDO8839601.1 hypothetical protein [Parvibaculum sp.]MDP2125659.1 hypothetical protein [Parvibaculum sp.]